MKLTYAELLQVRLDETGHTIIASRKFDHIGLYQEHGKHDASYIMIDNLDTLDRLIAFLQDARNKYSE